MSVIAQSWQLLKRELRVGLRTFLGAWLLLSTALFVYCLLANPDLHGPGDAALVLAFGGMVCALYTFWPALLVAAGRIVYRTLGWGAYLGAALVCAGIGTSLVLFRHRLGSLALEVLMTGNSAGPCGAHAVGPAGAALAMLCILTAILTSPASCWALAKLFLLLSLALLLGALPGLSLWLALVVRKIVGLARAGVSR